MSKPKDAGMVKSFIERDGEWVAWKADDERPWHSRVAALLHERDEAMKQVTALRAEVERLRTAIGNALTNGHMNALCWATNDDECVGRCRVLRDALKGE